MYVLIKAIAKKSFFSAWTPIDLTTVLLADALNDYNHVLALVQLPDVTDTEVLDLESLRQNYTNYPGTLVNLFTDIGNLALTTTAGTLDYTNHYLKYADAVRAGFKITPISQTGASDASIAKEDKTWIKLNKDNFDYSIFNQYALTTVNGFLHFSETSEQGVYIKEGMLSNQICQANTCGLLSFMDVGKIQCLPITEEMIFDFNGLDLFNKAILKIGEDLTNKMVLLSIGGYLVLPHDQVFRNYNTDSLIIDFANYPIINHHIESYQFLDYSRFNLEKYDINDKAVNVEELLSDTYIRNLLTMSQSFVILLEVDNLVIEQDHIRKAKMPGVYVSYETPLYPLIIGEGMFANYWYTYQKPYWSLNVDDGRKHYWSFNTTQTKALKGIDDQQVAGDPVTFSRSNYLKFYTQKFNIA